MKKGTKIEAAGSRGWRLAIRCAAFFIIAPSTFACSDHMGDPLPEMPYTWSSRRVILRTDIDVEICPGTLSRLDRHLDRLGESLGILRDPPEPAIIYLSSDPEVHMSMCHPLEPPYNTACYNPNIGASSIAPHRWKEGYTAEHELVHDFQYHSGMGSAPKLFTEGLAYSYAESTCLREMSTRQSVKEMLAMTPDYYIENRHDNRIDALFVTHLLENYPVEAFTNLLGSLEQTSPISEIEAQFKIHFGVDLDQVVDDFMASPEPKVDRSFRCSDPPVLPDNDGNGEWFSSRWHLSSSMSCDEEDVVTFFDKRNGAPLRGTWRTIEISRGKYDPESGAFYVRRSTPDLNMKIYRCLGCSSAIPHSFHNESLESIFVGWQGRYVILMWVESPEQANYSLEIWPHYTPIPSN